MRRKEREIGRDAALEIADKCEFAVMAVVDEKGDPYCVPLSIARKDNLIFFHCAEEGKKIDALKKNNKVCITCVGDTHRMDRIFSTEFESAVIFGTAAKISDDAEKTEALKLICERHTPLNMDNFDESIRASLHRTAVWRVTIDEITGKRKKYGADGKVRKE